LSTSRTVHSESRLRVWALVVVLGISGLVLAPAEVAVA
jgi:hypothetical protein